jgi:branched-chain amino acid transport system substrate-binding protein
MRRIRAMLALSLAAGLALSACGGGSDIRAGDGGNAEAPIKVGVIVPLSGSFAPEGLEAQRGYEMGVAKMGGRVAGRPVKLVFADAFAPEDVLAEADRLATRENVDLYIGTYSTPISQAGSDSAARHKLAFFETMAITDTLTERGLPNYIRVGPRAADFARTSAQFVEEALSGKLGKKVFIEHEDGPYGTSVSGTQKAALEEAGLQVTMGSHKSTATDVTDSVLVAKMANPDVWLVTGYAGDQIQLLRAAGAQNFKPKATVLVGAGDTKAVYEAIGADKLANTFVVAYTSPKINPTWAPGNAEFYSTYNAKYGREPLGTVANNAYNGTVSSLKILEEAGGKTDVESVNKAAGAYEINFGGLPNGWGLDLDDKMTNTRIRLVAVQWRPDGTVPAVWPAGAAADGEQMRLPNS